MSEAQAPRAGLGRRCLSLLYELLLVAAVLFAAEFVYLLLFGPPRGIWQLAASRVFLMTAIGLYFVPQWTRGGQTLPMKTWRIQIEGADGRPVVLQRALLRYLYAWLSCFAMGLGFLWALVDRDRQFFHDRAAGTRIVQLTKRPSGVRPTTSSA